MLAPTLSRHATTRVDCLWTLKLTYKPRSENYVICVLLVEVIEFHRWSLAVVERSHEPPVVLETDRKKLESSLAMKTWIVPAVPDDEYASFRYNCE